MLRMLLAADIGGTNTRLVLLEPGAGLDRAVDNKVYKSNDHASLNAIVRLFLAPHRVKVRAAAIGIAGPVLDGKASATNLDWGVDAGDLQSDLGIEKVALLNDLETTGIGLLRLPAASFRVLNEGTPYPSGNGALVAPGTGLGKAILVRHGAGFRPIPSEGGHADFAPRNAEQLALWTFLRDKYGHVSDERVLSGPGLKNLYDFLATRGVPEDTALSERIALAGSEAPAQVSLAGLAGASERTKRALDLFATLFGQIAQSLALTTLATGGVYLGGGIAPKILQVLVSGVFMEAFRDHPILGSVLSRMPVSVVLDDRASLLGAVTAAEELVSSRA